VLSPVCGGGGGRQQTKGEGEWGGIHRRGMVGGNERGVPTDGCVHAWVPVRLSLFKFGG
jgi:hypothetical protein